jgi:hypothetical protein
MSINAPTLLAATANLVWYGSQFAARRRFLRQLGSPAGTQARVLRDLLRKNAASAYGRRHGFASIRTPEEFAQKVPLVTYEELAPWVDRIRAGERAVLTTERVTRLVPTSGSAGARKLIPFTAALQREFDAAIGPWIADLYATHPRALLGSSYWSISPGEQGAAPEESAVPIGFDDDTGYLGGVRQSLVAATMAAPDALRHVADRETFFLLRRRDLRLISVWHPSFLLLLVDALPRHWDRALAILRDGHLPADLALPVNVLSRLALRAQPGRAAELERLGPDRMDQLWPNLAVISCWTDAHAALAGAEVARRFPGVAVQPKGLLSTEAFVTIPFRGRHPVAVGSHYFEFIDDSGAVHPVAALRADQEYEVVVTTAGGLWRYRPGDRVRVEGRVGRTPSLRFLGRTGNVSDLCGEKLSETFVGEVLRQLGQAAAPRFALLAPEKEDGCSGYTLFWEGGIVPSSAELDRRLAENPHYAWCRQVGQLRPARVFAVNAGGADAYYRHAAKQRKLGDIKPPPLARELDWAGRFAGRWAD